MRCLETRFQLVRVKNRFATWTPGDMTELSSLEYRNLNTNWLVERAVATSPGLPGRLSSAPTLVVEVQFHLTDLFKIGKRCHTAYDVTRAKRRTSVRRCACERRRSGTRCTSPPNTSKSARPYASKSAAISTRRVLSSVSSPEHPIIRNDAYAASESAGGAGRSGWPGET